jgi:hypothetical protein
MRRKRHYNIKNKGFLGRHHSKITKEKIGKVRRLKIGTIKTGRYYQRIKIAEHKWQQYHCYLIEKYLNYKLLKKWIIHHIDSDGRNNKLKNLYIFKSKAGHRHFETLIKFKEIDRFILKSNLKKFKRKYNEK